MLRLVSQKVSSFTLGKLRDFFLECLAYCQISKGPPFLRLISQKVSSPILPRSLCFILPGVGAKQSLTLWLCLVVIPIRTVCRVVRDVDGVFSYLVSLLTRQVHQYRVEGQCKKRGICCQNIAVYLSPGFWKYPILKQLAIRWYIFVYNFNYVAEDPNSKIVKFSCNYLKDNLCSIHWRRPWICRNYPSTRFFGRPIILPGCGYRIVENLNSKGT